MANTIFDTSVFMALLQDERIANPDIPHLRWASMSAVNAAEVCTLLEDHDGAAKEAGMYMLTLVRFIEPFTATQAKLAGELRRLGKNISLGDRACLALAIELDADVYTADKALAAFQLPCRIHLVR